MDFMNLSNVQKWILAAIIVAILYGLKKVFGQHSRQIFPLIGLLLIGFLLWKFRAAAGLVVMAIVALYIYWLKKGWIGFVTIVISASAGITLGVLHFVIWPTAPGTVLCISRRRGFGGSIKEYVEPIFSFSGMMCSLQYYVFSLLGMAMMAGMVIYYWKKLRENNAP